MDLCNYKYMDKLFLEEYKSMDSRDVYSQEKLRVEKIDNAIVLPYKVVDSSKCAGVIKDTKSYVELSAFEALSPVDSWAGEYVPEGEIEYIDEKVMYMGRYWKQWGHFIMDLVSRLWYAIEIDKNVKVVYDGESDISGVYAEFMRLSGIDENRLIRISKPTRFSSVIVPECSYNPGIKYTNEFKRIFDKVVENATIENNFGNRYLDKKIYFTRTGIKTPTPIELGEKDIEKQFADNGYQIISPEKHSLVEQIAMIRQAKEIACVAGTLPHNMIFAKDGAKLTIIRKTNKPNYRQTDVNYIRKLKVTQVDAHISPMAVGASGPFILDINENFKAFFLDRGMEIKDSRFLRFWKRKGRMLWFVPFYIARNKGKRHQVPLFDGSKFSTKPNAKKSLFKFYIKRAW